MLHNTKKIAESLYYKLLTELKNLPERKINISYKVAAFIDKPLEITISDGINNITETKNIVAKSINAPLTKERIKEQLEKLGNTPFKLKEINVDKDENIFIQIKELNELRRTLIDKLINEKTKKENIIINKIVNNVKNNKNNNLTLNILVRNEEQLKAALECNVNNIYTPDITLHKKYKQTYLRLPRIMNKRPVIENDNLLITEIGSICYTKDNNVLSDYYLNIINNNAIRILHENGVKQVTLSPEINDKINLIDTKNNNIEIIIYGYLEAMITKYCPLNMLLNNNKKPCSLCKDQYFLKDTNKKLFPIIQNNCTTTILNHSPINEINKLQYYQELEIKHYRIELFNENYYQTKEIINKIKKELI